MSTMKGIGNRLQGIVHALRYRIRFYYNLQPITYNLRASRGFTLIELLVVCAIMVLISTIVLANQGKFGGQVLLQNFAYDMALSIRQAQVYGISVQRFGAGTFNAGYGVHFVMSNPSSYVLFADSNKNFLYTDSLVCPQSPSAGSEFVQCSLINRGYSLSKLCATMQGSTEDCTVQTLDIVFVRPEPDALISANGTSCNPVNSSNCATSARIIVRSPRGETMAVTVWNNGQIGVDQKINN